MNCFSVSIGSKKRGLHRWDTVQPLNFFRDILFYLIALHENTYSRNISDSI